jgi:hypothetical protein
MKKAFASALVVSLCTTSVYAQQAPVKPPSAEPTPVPPAPPPPEDDKVGTNENLNQGESDVRPWAQGVAPDAQKKALELFREGNAQLNDGFFVEAAAKYTEALKYWDHPAISYNLALALNKLDKPVETYEQLEKSMRYGVAPLEKDKFDRAGDLFISVGRQIADIEISCQKAGAKISVDGKEVFTAPGAYKARVKAGKHTFVAEKEGYSVQAMAPYIGPGEPYRLDLKLYTAEELTRYNRRWEKQWVPWAVVGAGVVVAGAGLGLQFVAQSKYDDFDQRVEECNMDNAGCTITPELADIRASGDTMKTMSYIAFGVGAATAAVGLTMAYLNRSQPYSIRADQYEAEQRAAGRVTLAPMVAPGLAGAAVSGRF